MDTEGTVLAEESTDSPNRDGNVRFTALRKFLKDLLSAWSADRPARLAAALAYYAMFSIAPMAWVAITVAGIFIDESAVVDRVAAQIGESLGPEMVQLLEGMASSASLSSSAGSPLATLISAGALLYASTGLFSQLQYALDTIWGVPPADYAGTVALIKNRLLAFVMVIGLGILMVAAVIANVLISFLGTNLELGLPGAFFNSITLYCLMVVSFAIMYKVLPDVDNAWRDVWIGALVTALLMSIGGLAVGFYLRYSNVASAFGAASALVVMLIGVYYMAQIFLFGALFTRVYAEMYGSRADHDSDQLDE